MISLTRALHQAVRRGEISQIDSILAERRARLKRWNPRSEDAGEWEEVLRVDGEISQILKEELTLLEREASRLDAHGRGLAAYGARASLAGRRVDERG
jgi:hypothetical protein